MIQKIRSYLLDNEDNKDSIGLYVVILMMLPVLMMIFQYRKSIQTSLGTVNGKRIEKSIFNVCLFEKQQLMDNITKMFGEEQSNYFFNMLFQGRSLPEFILSEEIRRVFLQQRFEFLISQDYISELYITLNLNNKSLEKIKAAIGELPFLLVTGQLKPNALGRVNAEMRTIDAFCKEVFQVNFLKNSFLIPLSTIERLIARFNKGVPLKIDFTVFSFSMKHMGEYKKNIDKNSIAENEMKLFYDMSIKQGNFKKPRKFSFSISSYSLKGSQDKISKNDKNNKPEKNNVNDFLEKNILEKWNVIYNEGKNDFATIVSSLEKDFDRKKINKDVVVFFDAKGKVVSSTLDASDVLKNKIVAFAMNNKNNFFTTFIDNGILFLIENFNLSELDYYSFAEVRENIIEEIIKKRVFLLIKNELEQMRYALESKEAVLTKNCWIKEEKYFSDELSKSKDEAQKNFYDLVQKKLATGGLRNGSSFLDIEEGSHYKLYYVSGLSYEVKNENDNDNFLVRRDQFENQNVFIDSIEKSAKIHLND